MLLFFFFFVNFPTLCTDVSMFLAFCLDPWESFLGCSTLLLFSVHNTCLDFLQSLLVFLLLFIKPCSYFCPFLMFRLYLDWMSFQVATHTVHRFKVSHLYSLHRLCDPLFSDVGHESSMGLMLHRDTQNLWACRDERSVKTSCNWLMEHNARL